MRAQVIAGLSFVVRSLSLWSLFPSLRANLFHSLPLRDSADSVPVSVSVIPQSCDLLRFRVSKITSVPFRLTGLQFLKTN